MPAAKGSVVESQIRRYFEEKCVRYESTRGQLILPRNFNRVFQYEAIGHYDVPMIQQIWASFDAFALIRSGRVHAFADFSRVKGYDSEARRLGALGFRDRLSRWDTFHVLLPREGLITKLLSMAFSTITLVSSVPMKCYTDRARFAATLERYDSPR